MKNQILRHATVATACSLGLFLAAASAQATTIFGTINLSSDGTAAAYDVGNFLLTDDFSNAVRIDFPTGNNAEVDAGTGNLTGFDGDAAQFYDFTFDPVLAPNPVLIYTVTGGPSFTLTSLGTVIRAPGLIYVPGSGTMSLTGYDPTPGTFAFTMQNALSGQTAEFSWSATSAAQAVPAPAPIALVGIGLIGLVAFARRRAKL